jgi:hypothetical protein
MKKIFVLICLVAFFGAANKVQAQAQAAIGLKGGLNFANVDVENVSTNSRTGFHGGAFMLFKFSKIGIQPELIFSKQGTNFKFNSQDLESNYDYINIPIILKLYTVAGINIQVGPQFGFVAKAEQDVFDVSTNTVTRQDVKDQIKGSDISAAIGLGWDLPFGLMIDARYNLGLSKINDSSGSPESKNQVFQVALGYKFFKIGK